MKFAKKRIRITDHAAKRFLERAPDSMLNCIRSVSRSGDLGAIKSSIETLVITPEMRKLHQKLGDGRYPVGRFGLLAVIKRNSVVTILPIGATQFYGLRIRDGEG